jgi:molybdate transport system permease protein
MITGALWLSLKVTTIASFAIVLIGLPIAYLFARRAFPGKALFEAAILLPLVLPPSVVGYYLLIGAGPRNPLTTALPFDLLFTWQAAALASAVVGLPLMVQASKAAIASVDPAVENAARTLGSTEFEIFGRITLPLARRGIIAGVLLGAARAFGEFGATLMVAGSIPGRTQTVPLAIYDAVQAGRYTDARALVLLTTVLVFVSILVVQHLERQGPGPRHVRAGPAPTADHRTPAPGDRAP